MIERIRVLEQAAQVLEPSPLERASLTEGVLEYIEAFLKSLPTTPASKDIRDSGRGFYASPIGEPIPLEQALQLLRQNLDYQGQNLPSGRFMGFIPGNPLYHSALGDFLAAVTNRYSGHFFGSPGAVHMENLLLRWMADFLGYPRGAGGNLASGGSIATLTAIAAAREAHALKAKDLEKTTLYLSEQTHHAIIKGLRIAGLAGCIQRHISTDSRYRMVPEALEATMVEDKRQGLSPWLVIANAGTTNTGSVDPLEAIASIAQSHGLWLHVDAAYGGFFALCEQGKRILRGIEHSDSTVLDPHKGLYMPYGTGAVLLRDVKKLYAAYNYQADYTHDAFRDIGELSPSDLSPELSRHFRGLRMWLPLKLLGTQPFAAALEEKLLLAHYFYQQLQTLEGFEVGPAPDLSIVTFRYIPKWGDANTFNQQLVRAIQSDGRVFLSPTVLEDKFVIRCAILGFRTHLETIDLTLEVLQEKVRLLQETL